MSAIPDQPGVATLQEVDIDDRCLYSWMPTQLLGEVGIKPVRTQRFEAPEGRIFEREALSGLNLRIDEELQDLVPGGPYSAPANIAA